jgi:type IV pilus assembly protein PilA
MLSATRRTDEDQEGFTLIELMVVVLIIAILLAIAIPTFIGARTRAQDRAAQSNIRNALTAEKTTYFADKQAYAGALAGSAELTTLMSIEPAIGWFDGVTGLTPGKVGLVAGPQNLTTKDNLVLGAMSVSGTCFYEMDESSAGGVVAPGTFYSVSSSCTPPGAGPAPGSAPTTKAVDGGAAAGSWGVSW